MASVTYSYSDYKAAVLAGKNPETDILRTPPVVGRLAELAMLNSHGYFARDGADTPNVHGWKKIESVHRQAGFMTNLDMEVWKKGDTTVVSVLSVKSPLERNGDDIQFGAAKIAELQKKYPNLVVVGHGDKGSTIALAAAQKLQNEGKNVPPTLALEPFAPEGLSLKKDAPVLGINITPDTMLSTIFGTSQKAHDKAALQTGFPVRNLNGGNLLGNGEKIADSLLNSIDARAYYGALGMAAAATGAKDLGPAVKPPEQPWFIRMLNPSGEGEGDPRLNQIDKAGKEWDKKAATRAGLNYVPYSVSPSPEPDAGGPAQKASSQPARDPASTTPARQTLKPTRAP